MRKLAAFAILIPLASCASASKLIPLPNFFSKPKVDWNQRLAQDPLPAAIPTEAQSQEENIAAWVDYLRGKNLVNCEPILDRLVSYGVAAIPVLRKACEDPDSDIRYKATIVLGQLQDIRAAEILAQRLTDPSEEVGVIAARSLSLLGESWVVPKLFECFAGTQRHPSLRVRVEAARAAAKLGFYTSTPFLLAVLKENTRLAEPLGGLKDWEWRDAWAWEKWISGETLKELSNIDTQFDCNQGIPQMEKSIQPWIDWWEKEGSLRRPPASVQNDLRFQKIVEVLKDMEDSDDFSASAFARWLLQQLKLG